MATLKIGHYPINNNTASHTYAIMENFDHTYYFNCYGGTSDSGNEYPVRYYKPRSIWYTRGSSITNYTQLECNPYVAILLASWGSSVSFHRYVYNLKKGGNSGLGDNAGIIYALTGVCHQMCNTITCATDLSSPLNSLINWPKSLNASKLIYGNRGNCHHEEAVVHLLRRFSAYIPNIQSEEANIDTLPLDDIFEPINAEMNNAIKEMLVNGVTKEDRMMLIEDIAGRNDIDVEAILDVDMQVATAKNELDNLLIRDAISHQEYANHMNGYTKSLLERYRDVMTEEKFHEVFEGNVDDIECNIIDASMMPETYAEIRKAIHLD